MMSSFSCHGIADKAWRNKANHAYNLIHSFMLKTLADIHPHVEVTFKMDYRFSDAPPCRCEVCNRELVGYYPHKTAPETLCFSCGEYVDDVAGYYPELGADNFTSKEARYAAIARHIAEDCAQAAEDTDDAQEIEECLEQLAHMKRRAAQFDAIVASRLASASSEAPKRPDYNHCYWPSPRAKMFANYVNHNGPKITKHEDALAFLAQRAALTVEELLNMSPQTYIANHNYNVTPPFIKRLW